MALNETLNKEKALKKTPRAFVLSGDGINCETETHHALKLAGAYAEVIHVNKWLSEPDLLFDYDLLAFPGGFSFGDKLGSGNIFSLKIKYRVREALRRFVDENGLVIGICNGFQILVKLGLLPFPENKYWKQQLTLTHNDPPGFIDRWVDCEIPEKSRCVWTRGLSEIRLPIRNGEGRLLLGGEKQSDSALFLEKLEKMGCIALRYKEDINGSDGRIAGLSDPEGRVFGLMPHPEAFVRWTQHPQWTRGEFRAFVESNEPGLGLEIFKNAIRSIQEGD
jgi:phosphoribosylformylglycinamidine synthase